MSLNFRCDKSNIATGTFPNILVIQNPNSGVQNPKQGILTLKMRIWNPKLAKTMVI